MQTGRVEALYVDADGTMVGVKVDGLDVTGVEGLPTIVIPPLSRPDAGVSVSGSVGEVGSASLPDQRPVEIVGDKVAVRTELIDAWCSATSSDFSDAHLTVLPESVSSTGIGVQTDARVRGDRLEQVVDQVSMCVSTSVGEYGSVIARAPIADVDTVEPGVGAPGVLVSEWPTLEETTGVVLSGEGRKPVGVQASLIGVPVVEAAQHVLLETTSGVSQTAVGEVAGAAVSVVREPGQSGTGVLRDRAVCVEDVITSYVSPDELIRERAVHGFPPLIEACTTSVQQAVRDSDLLGDVGATAPRPGHCATCGQRLPDVERRPDESADKVLGVKRGEPGVVDTLVGSDVGVGVGMGVGDASVHPERVDDGTGVVTLRRVDGTMQTRREQSQYVHSNDMLFCPSFDFVVGSTDFDVRPSFFMLRESATCVIVDECCAYVSCFSQSSSKNFGCQYVHFPDQSDVFCQTSCEFPLPHSQTSELTTVSVPTDTEDLLSFSACLFQNVSITDFRERLVEHYYYAPSRGSILVSDICVQFPPLSVNFNEFASDLRNLSGEELAILRSRISDSYSISAYNFSVLSGRVSEVATEVSHPAGLFSGSYSANLASGVIGEFGVQAELQITLQELITQSQFVDIWEAFHSLSSNPDFYLAQQRYGVVKEQSSYVGEDPKSMADIGIQVGISVTISDFNLDSPVFRSSSPESTSNPYENYLARNRLGQISEQQCHAAPFLYSAATQTEVFRFTERFSPVNELQESIETYQYRLLRDEIAESCTQWDSEDEELIEEERLEDRDLHGISEEQLLEITERKRKRVVSQVQITEEVRDANKLVVCELGIQADPYDLHVEFSDSQTSSAIGRASWKESRGNQTDPINLSTLKSASDLSWADQDLYAVILAGITATRQRDGDVEGYCSPSTAGTEEVEKQLDNRYGIEGQSSKIMITIGCQTTGIRTAQEEEGSLRWIDETRAGITLLKTSGKRFIDQEFLARPSSLLSSQESEDSPMPMMIVQLRQRIIQYELFEARSSFPEAGWNNIREVASPTTGLFAPVATALRRGWISLGDRSEYINPATGETMPLATAYQLGRIRLATTPLSIQRSPEHTISEILLIERTCFNWRKVRLVSVVDTARGDTLNPEAAKEFGILEVTGNEIRFLDTITDSWLTIEEGVGRQMIEVVDIESSVDSASTEEDEPASCRVYFLTQLCPGGEPNAWMSPMEAVRLGLFNWETGDIAADWPAKPLLIDSDPAKQWPPSDFIPTRWCSFLTARHAGWLRLVEEPDPTKWIITHSVPYQEPNSILLSTQVNLVAYTTPQTTEMTDESQHRMMAPNRAQSEEVYSQIPSTTERVVPVHYSPQQPESGRSRSYNQFEFSEASDATYTIHRRQIHRRPYVANRESYHSGGNAPHSGSTSPTPLHRMP